MSLVHHVETFLGPIDKGWKLNDSSTGIQVVGFYDKPFEGATTYVTIGFSQHVLPMPNGRSVREELVVSAYKEYAAGAIASFLLTFCDHILSKHQALLRGDVIGPSGPIIPTVPVNAVYSAMPVLFDSGFATYTGTTPPTVLVWLIPIHAVEASFVRSDGWNKFEDMLEINNPDLLDLERKPII
jgi:hypothetical protein